MSVNIFCNVAETSWTRTFVPYCVVVRMDSYQAELVFGYNVTLAICMYEGCDSILIRFLRRQCPAVCLKGSYDSLDNHTEASG